MIASFFLTLREGLEAALIIGVLFGALNKLNQSQYRTSIWQGTGLAILLSVLTGFALNLLGASLEGRAEKIFEGIAMLTAAGILTWVILWMQNRARDFNKKLESNVQQAVLKDNKTALFLVAFAAVIREGVELTIFLTAAAMESDNSQILLGAFLGFAAVAVISYLLFKSLVRLDISKFFQVTSVILILFAAGLTAHGIHEFNEAGLIPPLVDHVWDINPILDENSTLGELLKTLFGYNGNPSLTEIFSYFLYFVIIWFFSNKSIKKSKKI
ncbi:MAG: FTR1 family protein [Anaerolineales bacterium]|nr:FTR1 family protein [Anaerolineales bacterium]